MIKFTSSNVFLIPIDPARHSVISSQENTSRRGRNMERNSTPRQASSQSGRPLFQDPIPLPTYGFPSVSINSGVDILQEDLSHFLRQYLDLEDGIHDHRDKTPLRQKPQKPRSRTKPVMDHEITHETSVFQTPTDKLEIPSNVDATPSTPNPNPGFLNPDEGRGGLPPEPTASSIDSHDALSDALLEAIQNYLLKLFPGGSNSELAQAHVQDMAIMSRTIAKLDMDPKTRNLGNRVGAVLAELPPVVLSKRNRSLVENDILEIIRASYVDDSQIKEVGHTSRYPSASTFSVNVRVKVYPLAAALIDFRFFPLVPNIKHQLRQRWKHNKTIMLRERKRTPSHSL
ncbi:hypothetical protein Hypma_009371 [Hypsizygus marmoreus]|uniref:Uncharacterized protein n=1 Tax=Hypsizygus marmoreus TaxID=39966 RepID=A0A369JQ36_HYPMA|nr:hypothetical protein Hypma_009371 [Hypsizygus marmoreus]